MKQVITVYAINDNGVENVKNNRENLYDTKEKVKERLAQIFKGGNHMSFNSVSRTGVEYLGGVGYDFRPFLKLILVKQYGGWTEYYAPNKTALRKCLHGRIERILYIQDRI